MTAFIFGSPNKKTAQSLSDWAVSLSGSLPESSQNLPARLLRYLLARFFFKLWKSFADYFAVSERLNNRQAKSNGPNPGSSREAVLPREVTIPPNPGLFLFTATREKGT
jgi:hypothetical protein